MNWKKWVDKGDLRPLRTGREQAGRLLQSAEEQLGAAQAILEIGLCAPARDQAYEAMLKAGMALILWHGYRAESGSHHAVTAKVVGELLGPEQRGLAKAFNDLRKKRRERLYEGVDACTDAEARRALERGRQLLGAARGMIQR